ncbi:hypothetical protein D9M69_599630 [compost metagenome]
MITAPPMATTPQNLASMASINATSTTAPPRTTAFRMADNRVLMTPSTAPSSTQAIKAYIISLVMARSIE